MYGRKRTIAAAHAYDDDAFVTSREDSQMGWSLDRFFYRSMTPSSAPRAGSDIVRESQ